MEKRTIIVCASALFLITLSLLGARSGHASCDPFPSVDKRAREAAIVVVATVGDPADTTVDEDGFLDSGFPDGRIRLQCVVQVVLKGTAIPDTLLLPFMGLYSTFYWAEYWGWPCALYTTRGEVVLLFLEGVEDRKPLQYDQHGSIFQLRRLGWDPSLLQTDATLLLVQQSLAGPSRVESQKSWGLLKRSLR